MTTKYDQLNHSERHQLLSQLGEGTAPTPRILAKKNFWDLPHATRDAVRKALNDPEPTAKAPTKTVAKKASKRAAKKSTKKPTMRPPVRGRKGGK